MKFIFSGKTTSAEDEIQYIDKMKEQGAEGIISFGGFASGIQDIIEECEKEEMYYALGSNTISDENYEAVKDVKGIEIIPVDNLRQAINIVLRG